MPQIRIQILPDQDLKRLREIADAGTLEGNADLRVIVKYLASAIEAVGEGQKQTADNLQKVADAAGVGR